MSSIIAGISLLLITAGGQQPATSTYLIVYTHPDDEQLSSSFLAAECNRLDIDCHFLYTKARASVNFSGGQCMFCAHPEPPYNSCGDSNSWLHLIRSAELNESLTTLFDAKSIVELGLPNDNVNPFGPFCNVVTSILNEWETAVGDLTGEMKTYIEGLDPDKVFTHDPRHGTTCHGEHRATAQVVTDAIALMANAPDLYYNETAIINSVPSPASAADELAGLYLTWSGSAMIPDVLNVGTVAAREYFRYVLEIHMSQYAPSASMCDMHCPDGTPCFNNVENHAGGPDSYYISRFALAENVVGKPEYDSICPCTPCGCTGMP